jgi:hypothetical protein
VTCPRGFVHSNWSGSHEIQQLQSMEASMATTIVPSRKDRGVSQNGSKDPDSKLLLYRTTTEREGILSSPSGMLPVRQLSERERFSSLDNLPREDGMVPVMEPPLKFSSWRVSEKIPSSSGIVHDRLFHLIVEKSQKK